MDLGGVENAVLQLLESMPGTHMLVTHLEGLRAPEARTLAGRYSPLGPRRFLPLLQALRDCDVAHQHTINDHLLFPLAAQLSGCAVILQTVHNHFTPRACHFMDHSVAVGPTLGDMLPTPGHVSTIPNGVPCPPSLPERLPWHQEGRPLVLVEMRRADKDMSCTLEQLVCSGALDGLDFEARVLGFHKDSPHPRLTFLGPQSDPYPYLAQADVLVHGTAGETFGRTVYEAMACGVVPVATPITAYTKVFSPEQLYYLPSHEIDAAAHQLRGYLDHLAAHPAQHAAMRRDNHDWVRENASIVAMVERYQALYRDLLQRGPAYRNFGPQDLEGVDLELFALLVDDLLDHRPPLHLARIEELDGPAKGILYWLLVDLQLVPEQSRLVLLRAASLLLGDRHEVCLALGRALAAAGDDLGAVEQLARAVELHPGNLAPYPDLVERLLAAGKLERALELVERGCGAVPGYLFLEQIRQRLSQAVASS